MNISELIKKLQEIQNEDGDLDVRVIHDGFEESIGKMEYYTDRHILYIEQYEKDKVNTTKCTNANTEID